MNKGVGAGNSRHPRRKVWAPHPHLKTALWYYIIAERRPPAGTFMMPYTKTAYRYSSPFFCSTKENWYGSFQKELFHSLQMED